MLVSGFSGMIVHCHESHAPQNLKNPWSPNITSVGAGQGVRVCAPLPGVSQVWEREGRSPLKRRGGRDRVEKQNKENHQEMSKRRKL
jgi:hypothetical protein